MFTKKSKLSDKFEGIRNNKLLILLSSYGVLYGTILTLHTLNAHQNTDYEFGFDNIEKKENDANVIKPFSQYNFPSIFKTVPDYELNSQIIRDANRYIDSKIPLIVMHYTSIPQDATNSTRRQLNKAAKEFKGSVQFSLTKDGTIDVFIDPVLSAVHTYTGKSSWMFNDFKGKNLNRNSIGIEIYYLPDPFDDEEYKDREPEKPTESQLQALATFLYEMELKFNSGPDYVTDHSSLQPTKSGQRTKEPGNLVYSRSKDEKKEITIDKNWYIIADLVKQKGGWSKGKFASMSSKEVANYILKRNATNAISILNSTNTDDVDQERLEAYINLIKKLN